MRSACRRRAGAASRGPAAPGPRGESTMRVRTWTCSLNRDLGGMRAGRERQSVGCAKRTPVGPRGGRRRGGRPHGGCASATGCGVATRREARSEARHTGGEHAELATREERQRRERGRSSERADPHRVLLCMGVFHRYVSRRRASMPAGAPAPVGGRMEESSAGWQWGRKYETDFLTDAGRFGAGSHRSRPRIRKRREIRAATRSAVRPRDRRSGASRNRVRPGPTPLRARGRPT